MKSFEKVMNEIHNKNFYKYGNGSKLEINTNNTYMFELIISEINVEKIFDYLINSNYFQFFKGICILIEKKENMNENILFQIKKKYAKYTKDIYFAQNDIESFLKRTKEASNYRNNKSYKKYITTYPIIDYTNYLTQYYKLHQGASVYYNKYSINSYQIIEKVFLDFLIAIDNFKYKINNNNFPNKIKEMLKKFRRSSKNIENEKNSTNENKNKLFNIIKLLDIIKEKYIDDCNVIIQNYRNDYKSFYDDFNYWLNNLDQLAHQKICYFIGSLLYNLDNSTFYYKNDNYNGINNSPLILYKEISGNYIDLLLYEKNKNQIITFPSFLFCTEKCNNNIKHSHYKDNYSILYKISYNLRNQNEYVHNLFDLFDSKAFQLFTFYKINDIKIKHKEGTAVINLEPINKKEYLELKLKQNEAINYNPNLNIMEPIYYENINNNNSNINQSNISISNNISNIYITSTVNVSKYLQYFNKKYNKNINTDMTSIILENSNLGNFGLLVLSKIKFNELVVLNLDSNKISDLTPLKVCNFPKLKKLSLGSDNNTGLKYKIKDISPLINCNFTDLLILNLKNNLISDISYLLFMNFPNLLILDLSYNNIQSIHVFSSANFPKLETLDLCNNQINDITPLNNYLGKKNKIPKNIENSSIINTSNISNILSNSQSTGEIHKNNVVLQGLKVLKIKHNKLTIDEGFLMTIKALKNRGVTILK